MRCPDCKDTKVYIGLGWLPAEPCRTCAVSPKAAAAADEFALPDGLRWQETIVPSFCAHYIVDSITKDVAGLWNDSRPFGKLLDRPDAEELIALLCRKNRIA